MNKNTITIVIAIVGIVIAYFTLKKFGLIPKGTSKLATDKTEFRLKPSKTSEKGTLTISEVTDIADTIYKSFKGMGTDEETLFAELYKIPTKVDLKNISSYYGSKYGDLFTSLKSELSTSEFKRAEKIINTLK